MYRSQKLQNYNILINQKFSIKLKELQHYRNRSAVL
jgi:hypothetical protein